jgi:hypothetical protein
MSSEDSDGLVTYKIGLTKNNPEIRCKQLQCGNPNIISIIYEYKSIYPHETEAYLHRIFKLSNIHNEWFDLNLDQVSKFLYFCQQGDDIYKLLNTENTYYNQSLNK